MSVHSHCCSLLAILSLHLDFLTDVLNRQTEGSTPAAQHRRAPANKAAEPSCGAPSPTQQAAAGSSDRATTAPRCWSP